MSHSRIRQKHSQTPHRREWYTFWPVWGLSAALLSTLAYGFVQVYRAEGPQKSDVQVTTINPGQDVHLDPSRLLPKHLRLFEVNDSGQKVRFVVQRSQDRVVHVALASCKSCYHSKDPHYTRNGEMICGQCKQIMDFESRSEKTAKGNCLLPEIQHTEKDHDMAVLSRDVLAQAAKSIQ